MLDGGNRDDGTEPPGVEEQYLTACNTSNLTVEERVKGAGDLLIASGWAPHSVGKALLRLASEYARAELPQRMKPRTVKQFAAILPRIMVGTDKRSGKPIEVRDMEGAMSAHLAEKLEFDRWYEQQVQALIGKLKDLPGVRANLTVKAAHWGMEDPETKATATIRYWLDQRCRGCGGTKWLLIPGTNRQSERPCPVCVDRDRHPREQHPGYQEPVFGQEGRRLANYLDACVADARGMIGRELSARREKKGEPAESPPQPIGVDDRTEEEKAKIGEAFALRRRGKP